MTNQELLDYYADLLILQYLQKPKAYDTIQALAGMAIIDQLPIAVQNAFNIDTAVGDQLDVLGQYAGVQRTDYGLDGLVTLTDDDYRQLIRLGVLQNSSGSSLYDIQNLLWTFFEGLILVFDYQEMRMGYFIDSAVGSFDLASIFVGSGYLLKPMGVTLSTTIYAENINAFFGFRTYTLAAHNASPYNTYADYQMDWPWLSYLDALTPSGELLTQAGDILIQEDEGELLYG